MTNPIFDDDSVNYEEEDYINTLEAKKRKRSECMHVGLDTTTITIVSMTDGKEDTGKHFLAAGPSSGAYRE